MRPPLTTYPAYFNTYIKLVEPDNLQMALEKESPVAVAFFKKITENQSTYKYAENKWTIKEILQHVADAERIFAYRALVISRGDTQILHSFDENSYAANANANSRPWQQIVEEFIAVRTSTVLLFKPFSEKQLNAAVKTDDYSMTVLALGYTIVGHVSHHINMIKERYLDI